LNAYKNDLGTQLPTGTEIRNKVVIWFFFSIKLVLQCLELLQRNVAGYIAGLKEVQDLKISRWSILQITTQSLQQKIVSFTSHLFKRFLWVL